MNMNETGTLEAMNITDGAEEMKGKYLTFWTDKQLYGVPIANVVQIVGVQSITEVPDFPSYAKGIINLRGSIIPIVDVRCRFCKEEIPYDEHTCIIVSNIHGRLVGFVVDSVNEVTTIKDDNISPPPQFSSDYANNFLTGVGRLKEGVTLLLDLSKLFSDDEFDALAQE